MLEGLSLVGYRGGLVGSSGVGTSGREGGGAGTDHQDVGPKVVGSRGCPRGGGGGEESWTQGGGPQGVGRRDRH